MDGSRLPIVQYQLTPPSWFKEHVDLDWGGGMGGLHGGHIESNRQLVPCAKAGSCFHASVKNRQCL